MSSSLALRHVDRDPTVAMNQGSSGSSTTSCARSTLQPRLVPSRSGFVQDFLREADRASLWVGNVTVGHQFDTSEPFLMVHRGFNDPIELGSSSSNDPRSRPTTAKPTRVTR